MVVYGEVCMVSELRHDYPVSGVAKLLCCAPSTVKAWIKQGRIKAYRLGGETGRDWRIPWAEVERVKSEWLYSPEINDMGDSLGNILPK
jgi:excisionase family DNA binding protein